MHRREFIRNGSLFLGSLTLAQQGLLSGWAQEPWKISMLTDNLGIFTERGGTIAFLLGKKEIVVVDSQFPDQSKHLIDELKKKSEQPFSTLINTHHHADHTSGNISFKGLVTHVLAHENSLKNQRDSATANKSEDKQLYPDQTYSLTWCQKAGKENICLYYYGAAHTNGDSFIHFEHADIVHCGDLVFNRRHPVVDRKAGASLQNWVEVLNKGLSKFSKNTRYIFGHAATGYEVTGNASDLEAFRDYIGNLLKFVEGEIKSGKSKEEILKATSIPGAAEWKGDGIQRSLQAAYDELIGS